jgi:hypothetical protein
MASIKLYQGYDFFQYQSYLQNQQQAAFLTQPTPFSPVDGVEQQRRLSLPPLPLANSASGKIQPLTPNNMPYRTELKRPDLKGSHRTLLML